MDSAHRTCRLIFDKMSVQPALPYSKKQSLGLAHVGHSYRRHNFADHIHVFMARGIRRKWKQPICFYFNQGGLTSAEMKSKLQLSIRTLTDIVLIVIVTVCDQAVLTLLQLTC